MYMYICVYIYIYIYTYTSNTVYNTYIYKANGVAPAALDRCDCVGSRRIRCCTGALRSRARDFRLARFLKPLRVSLPSARSVSPLKSSRDSQAPANIDNYVCEGWLRPTARRSDKVVSLPGGSLGLPGGFPGDFPGATLGTPSGLPLGPPPATSRHVLALGGLAGLGLRGVAAGTPLVQADVLYYTITYSIHIMLYYIIDVMA